MPVFTLKIQYSQHFSDQFIQKGEVDKERAVEEFQLFPWDKEIDNYNRSTDNASAPHMVFTSDNGIELVIMGISAERFEMGYRNVAANKCSVFLVSNDFEKDDLTPEEIIELLFEGELENHLKLEEIPKEEDIEHEPVVKVKKEVKEMADLVVEPKPKPGKAGIKKNENEIEYTFKAVHSDILSIRFVLFLLASGIYLWLWANKELHVPFIFHFFFPVIWAPPLILHLTYLIKNSGAKIIINTNKHELTYIKGAKEIKFNREDIFRCQITFCSKPSSTCYNYSYVWFILNDNRHVVVTHFVGDPLEIAETLNCKYEIKDRKAPFLPVV
jgi:hypothetical protein